MSEAYTQWLHLLHVAPEQKEEQWTGEFLTQSKIWLNTGNTA